MEIKKYLDKEFWIYLVIALIILSLVFIYGLSAFKGLDPFFFLILPSIFGAIIPFIVSYIVLSSVMEDSRGLAFFTIFLAPILASILMAIIGILIGAEEGFMILILFGLIYGGVTSLYLLIIYIIKLLKVSKP